MYDAGRGVSLTVLFDFLHLNRRPRNVCCVCDPLRGSIGSECMVSSATHPSSRRMNSSEGRGCSSPTIYLRYLRGSIITPCIRFGFQVTLQLLYFYGVSSFCRLSIFCLLLASTFNFRKLRFAECVATLREGARAFRYFLSTLRFIVKDTEPKP